MALRNLVFFSEPVISLEEKNLQNQESIFRVFRVGLSPARFLGMGIVV